MTDTEATLTTLLEGFLEEGQAMIETAAPISSLGLESIRIMEFVLEVEDHYDIAIDLDSLAHIETLADLARVVNEQTEDA